MPAVLEYLLSAMAWSVLGLCIGYFQLGDAKLTHRRR